MPLLKRIARGFEADVASIILGLMLAVMTLQVFTRYVLNDSPDWTEEALRYMYVWVVFLGSSAAITDRTHVSISFLVEKLPRNWQIAMAVLTNTLVIVFLGFLLYWGIVATISQHALPLMTMDVAYSVVYVIVPVTAALMIVRLLLVMHDDVVHKHAASDEAPKPVL
jgi:TRAP-type C4-dicarboxylate transport system permease small subunit